MRRNSELVVVKNIYCLVGVFILVSSFAGCAAGSCLSYGHSCWGAHGKRSGPSARPLEGVGDRRLPPIDQHWLLSRLIDRQLMQVPLEAKLRARLQQPLAIVPLDEEMPAVKHSATMEKLSEDVNARELPRGEQRLADGEPTDILLIPDRKDFTNDDDQAIKMGLYKILKNINEKLK